mmetsp:Transcript_29318/g.74304  ORF Transcript_29318/g.74304 Transcript_29318/m.74304 type:complete len:216 (-) Transcript_29318:717-1364(-)
MAVCLEPASVRLDEALGECDIKAALNVHRHKILLVQGLGRRAPERHDIAPVEAKAHLAAHVLLSEVERVLEELHLGGEPEAVVAKLGVLEGEPVTNAQHLAVQGECLDVEVSLAEDGAARRLVDATRLDADVAVLDNVDAPDSVGAAEDVEHLQDLRRSLRLLPGAKVDNLDGVPVLVEDLDVIVLVLGLREGHCVLVARVGSRDGGVLEDARLE